MTHPAPTHSAQLRQVWEQSSRDAAVALVRTFISHDATLAELRSALAAAPTRAHAATIRLREVVGSLAARPAAPAAPPTIAASPAIAMAAPLPAPRRRPRQGPQLRAALVEALRGKEAGMTTVELTDMLARAGNEVTPVRVTGLLRACEAAGDIVSLGGRPKTWRARVRGRSVPEPVVIRKAVDIRRAQEQPAEPATPTHATPLPEVNPSDIHAVAAILRRRFFAPDGAPRDKA